MASQTDTDWVLSVILGTHVLDIAMDVMKDTKLSFRIATALGKDAVKRLKLRIPKLKVGDIMMTKKYLVPLGTYFDGHTLLDTLPIYYHVQWCQVAAISKTSKNVTMKCLGAKEKFLLPGIIHTMPVMDDPEAASYKPFLVRKLGKNALLYKPNVFFISQLSKNGFYYNTYETVDTDMLTSKTYFQVPVSISPESQKILYRQR
jgi:hypothetical protein